MSSSDMVTVSWISYEVVTLTSCAGVNVISSSVGIFGKLVTLTVQGKGLGSWTSSEYEVWIGSFSFGIGCLMNDNTIKIIKVQTTMLYIIFQLSDKIKICFTDIYNDLSDAVNKGNESKFIKWVWGQCVN